MNDKEKLVELLKSFKLDVHEGNVEDVQTVSIHGTTTEFLFDPQGKFLDFYGGYK